MTPGGGVLARDDRELLGFVADGWSMPTIARVFGVSPDEIRGRVRELLRGLGIAAPAPASAARLAILSGITGPVGD